MTQEHITITEEVQKDGTLQTITRETVQTTVPTPEEVKGQQAMGVTHPEYVSAADRVYEYDEELGMSRSVPRTDKDDEDELTLAIEELEASNGPTDPIPEQETVIPGGTNPLVEPDTGFTPMTFGEPETTPHPDPICHHPVGNGECQLEAGHTGAHKLNVD